MRYEAGRPRVVVVGGGFAGLYAARILRKHPIDVTVIDRRNHHLFQPLLYQVATAGLSPSEIAYPIRAIFSDDDDVRVLLGEVTGFDLDGKRVLLGREAVPYDYLIVAAGSRYHYFGHEEWASTAPALKSLEDALDIRRRILLAFEHAERESDAERRRELLTFAVVGGGPTGVELAGAIAEIAKRVLVDDFRSIDPREARVILLEAAPRILGGFSERLSGRAEASLRKLGVDVRTNAVVVGVDERGVSLEEDRVTARTVVWAAGVLGSPLAEALGAPLDRQGRVEVAADLSLSARPEVFVVGDLAHVKDAGGDPLPGLAPVAIQQGEHAARNVLRAAEGKPSEPFAYRDKGIMATIGRASAVAQFGSIELSGFVAWLAWLGVHVFFLIGFRNRIMVTLDWAYSYVTWGRAARLITGDLDAEDGGATPPKRA